MDMATLEDSLSRTQARKQKCCVINTWVCTEPGCLVGRPYRSYMALLKFLVLGLPVSLSKTFYWVTLPN